MGVESTTTDRLTQGDLDKIAGLLDRQFDDRIRPFVKEEIEGVRSDLKTYINEGIETVMGAIDDMADKKTVERMGKYVKQIGKKVGIEVDL